MQGQLSASDKIDKIVTNRWLGLPIFAVVMFLVYWIAMVTVGAAATDWANDGLFGDGWHLLGIGSSAIHRGHRRIHRSHCSAVSGLTTIEIDAEAEDFDRRRRSGRDEGCYSPTPTTATIEVEDEETLAINDMTVYYDAIPDDADEENAPLAMTYVDAVSLPRRRTALTSPIPPTTACGSPAFRFSSATAWKLPAQPTGSAA